MLVPGLTCVVSHQFPTGLFWVPSLTVQTLQDLSSIECFSFVHLSVNTQMLISIVLEMCSESPFGCVDDLYVCWLVDGGFGCVDDWFVPLFIH